MVHGLNEIIEMNEKATADSVVRMMSFVDKIRRMNQIFELEVNVKVTHLGAARAALFHKVISDEKGELADCYDVHADHVDLVKFADCLGDLVVYCFSEATRWGIPLLDVLHAIMDSQESKLVDGKPLKAADGSKFEKGSNYTPPEDKIRELIVRNS